MRTSLQLIFLLLQIILYLEHFQILYLLQVVVSLQTGTYNSGTKTYTITYAITSSGTLKQNLYELDDVDPTTVTAPTGGYILSI